MIRMHLPGEVRTAPPVVLDVRVVAGTTGGPDKTILRTPRYVDPSRYRVVAAYMHPHGDPCVDGLRDTARELDCPLETVGERGRLDLRTVTHMLELVRRLNVALWHGHDYKSNLLGLLLRRRHPMRLVTTLHGWTDQSWRMRLYHRIDEACIARYEHVIAVSAKLADRCRRIGVPDDRLTLLPNGIETDRFMRQADQPTAAARFGIGPDRLVIGIVSRLSHEKGVDRMIEPMRQLVARNPRALLLVLGDGPERATLEARCSAAGLQDHVRFCGWQSPLTRWYEAMHVLVLPSRTEGLPNAVLEAMAMRVPVAATDVGGVRELLDGGRCGSILMSNEAHWFEPIGRLLADHALRDRFARLARLRIEQRYSFTMRTKNLLHVYDRLLETPDRQTRRAA